MNEQNGASFMLCHNLCVFILLIFDGDFQFDAKILYGGKLYELKDIYISTYMVYTHGK